MRHTEHNAAKTLLDRGIKVPVTAPLWLRVFGKKTVLFLVRQPSIGTLMRISLLYLSMRIPDDQLEELGNGQIQQVYIRHGRVMAAIAAQAILNGYWSGRLLGKVFGRWLYWKISPVMLQTIVNVLVTINGSESFTNSIRSVQQMKMTTPNLSQTAEGS